MKSLNLSDFAIKENCFEKIDKKLDSYIIDPEKLQIALKKYFLINQGTILLETHSPSLLKDFHITKIIVLTCDIPVLRYRLKHRKYSGEKIKTNLDSELFEVVYGEVLEFFPDTDTIVYNQEELDLLTKITNFLFSYFLYLTVKNVRF